MASQSPSRQAVIHAYRQLYRQSLKAINYSTPARHLVLQTMRQSFRSPTQAFDPRRISNTLDFLRNATEVRGLEHRILRNLLLVKYWDQPRMKSDKSNRRYKPLGINQNHPKFQKNIREQFNKTLMLFNESVGTCLQ
ncbi:hypothetical protein BJX68DRAFT_183162 [Aspergillus pseudodeflectus]|uniref:DUF1763-domain-containing protein n=1 Tax=Aspergillus pseudodeflectus TaxID=176178 RepID=A0ABR4JLC0_9EURO